MINENRIQFFEALLKSLKWKWTEEEQLALWDNFPYDIQNGNFGKLLVSIVENLDSKPKKQALKNYVWNFSKGIVEGKKKTVIEHAGCNNCISGYFNFPSIEHHKEYSYAYKITDIMEFPFYPQKKLLCSCTGNKQYITDFDNLKNIFFNDRKIYEFCYISLFVWCHFYLNPKRFKEFDTFNPYATYNVICEPCHLLKIDELEHFKYVFTGMIHHSTPEIKPKIIGESYNKKIYGGTDAILQSSI